jgi:solute carrier family 25 carnitine/acylcarnitine transporter 20/29
MAPIERVKCLLQIQSSNKKYRGTFDCARQLFKEGGLRLLYKGTFATLLRDVPSNGTFFATYEFTKRYLTSQEKYIDIFIEMYFYTNLLNQPIKAKKV